MERDKIDLRYLLDELIKSYEAQEYFSGKRHSDIQEGDIIIPEVSFPPTKPQYLEILDESRYIKEKNPIITVKITSSPPTNLTAPFPELGLSAGEYFMLGKAKKRPSIVVSSYIRKKEKFYIAFPLSSFKNVERKEGLLKAFKTFCFLIPFRWLILTKDLRNDTYIYSLIIMEKALLIPNRYIKRTAGHVKKKTVNTIKAWYMYSLGIKENIIGNAFNEIREIQSYVEFVEQK